MGKPYLIAFILPLFCQVSALEPEQPDASSTAGLGLLQSFSVVGKHAEMQTSNEDISATAGLGLMQSESEVTKKVFSYNAVEDSDTVEDFEAVYSDESEQG